MHMVELSDGRLHWFLWDSNRVQYPMTIIMVTQDRQRCHTTKQTTGRKTSTRIAAVHVLISVIFGCTRVIHCLINVCDPSVAYRCLPVVTI